MADTFTPSTQVECRAWMAADVAGFGLVPAQSKSEKARGRLHGITTQRPAGCWLPTKTAQYMQVGSNNEVCFSFSFTSCQWMLKCHMTERMISINCSVLNVQL